MKAQKVGIHKNLHRAHNNKGDWSVKHPSTFKLFGHRNEVMLEDCSFKVRQSGVKTFRESREKTVHALAIGSETAKRLLLGWVEISYHPAVGHFFIKGDAEKKPLDKADNLWFTSFADGWKLFAINPRGVNND